MINPIERAIKNRLLKLIQEQLQYNYLVIGISVNTIAM